MNQLKFAQENLIKELISTGWLKTPRIIEAFSRIKREDFVSSNKKALAYINEALPIGYNQTISQPLVVAFMLELLQPQVGEKILDIGAGSGWTTALLAYLVNGGELKSKIQGRVIALEIIPELADFAKKNVNKYNFIKKGIVQIFCANGRLGYKKEAPYDKILISATTSELPFELFKQLKIGGKMVLPINDSIVSVDKISQNDYKKQEFPGFVFVPLV